MENPTESRSPAVAPGKRIAGSEISCIARYCAAAFRQRRIASRAQESAQGRSDRNRSFGDGAGGILGEAGAGIQSQVSIDRVGDHPAGGAGSLDRGGQTNRQSVLVPGEPRAAARRTVYDDGRALRNSRLPAGQSVLGAFDARVRCRAAFTRLRMDGQNRYRRGCGAGGKPGCGASLLRKQMRSNLCLWLQ